MITLIVEIILLISLLGMLVILLRKIPVLAELPETQIEFNLKAKLIEIKEKIKTSKYFHLPSFEIVLQKILSKIRILTLKTDNKTANWLQRLREKSQKNKFKEDNYWQEIKKATKDNENLPV